MRFLRGFLIVATLVGVVGLPVLVQRAADVSTPAAIAAVASSNANEDNDNNNNNNNNGNDNNNNNNNNGNDNNGNGNGNGNGNDNVECFPDLNSNDNVPCNFNGNGNANENVSAGNRIGNSITGTTKCFSVQEVGLIQRSLGDGDVTVSVPPDAGLNFVTRLTLHSLGTGDVPPATGGSFLDTLIFRIDAQDGCDGAPIVQLSGPVNLGVTYRIPADKAKLQIVMLSGGSWQNVTTVPDPTNTYISATIQTAGTYAVIQKP